MYVLCEHSENKILSGLKIVCEGNKKVKIIKKGMKVKSGLNKIVWNVLEVTAMCKY
jgi:hypothetical protein